MWWFFTLKKKNLKNSEINRLPLTFSNVWVRSCYLEVVFSPISHTLFSQLFRASRRANTFCFAVTACVSVIS